MLYTDEPLINVWLICETKLANTQTFKGLVTQTLVRYIGLQVSVCAGKGGWGGLFCVCVLQLGLERGDAMSVLLLLYSGKQGMCVFGGGWLG